MKIEEAQVGAGVIYTPAFDKREDGVITSFNDRHIFVRYMGDQHSKATHPADLELL